MTSKTFRDRTLPEGIRIRELEPGDLFQYESKIHIVTDFSESAIRYSCVELNTGKLHYFEDDTIVKRVFTFNVDYTLE